MKDKSDDRGELTPELIKKIFETGAVNPTLAYMITVGLPITAETWAKLEYHKPLDELEAEELSEMPEVLRDW